MFWDIYALMCSANRKAVSLSMQLYVLCFDADKYVFVFFLEFEIEDQ